MRPNLWRWTIVAAALGTGLAPAAPGRAAERGHADEPELPEVGSWELTQEERELARRVAEAHLDELAAKQPDGAPEQFFVGTELYRDKHAPHRQARVIHYRPEGDVTIYTVVDLVESRATGMSTAAHVPTSLSEVEFERARDLALADPAVRKALGSSIGDVVVEPMLLRTLDASDPMFGHRAVRLLFRVGSDYLREPVVVVDLSLRRVTIEPTTPFKPGK